MPVKTRGVFSSLLNLKIISYFYVIFFLISIFLKNNYLMPLLVDSVGRPIILEFPRCYKRREERRFQAACVCCCRFCGECLQPCLQVTSPLCPLCRVPFDPKKVERSSSVEKQLASYKAPCRGCSKKVSTTYSQLIGRWFWLLSLLEMFPLGRPLFWMN